MKKISSIFFFPIVLFCLNLSTFAQDYTYYNNLAKEEYDKKNYYNTIDYANKSLNASSNGAAYWYRGMARYGLSNYTDATSDFSSAISYYSSDNTSLGGLYYWRALCRYKQDNYKDALPDFETAKNYGYEDKLNMYWTMAYSYYKTDDYSKAEEFYTNAMNYTSDNSILAQLYKGRGDIKYDQFKIKDAIDDYTKAIEDDPNYTYAFWARGIARAADSQDDLAIGDYTSAINLIERSNKPGSESDLASLYSNRGRLQYLSNKNDEAKADLQKSLSLNPNFDRGNKNMGDLLFQLKKYKEAIRYYQQAASLFTNDADKTTCFSSMYSCSINLLDYPQALSYINSALAISSDYGGYYDDRAHIYFVKKNYASSLIDYSKAIDLYSDDKYGLYTNNLMLSYLNRADVKRKLKDNEGALADFQKAVEIDSTSAYAFYHLGRFYKKELKQNDKAAIYLKKAIELSTKKDTTSDYIYSKVILGEKQEAFKVAVGLIKKDVDNKDRLKWDYYNAACIYALAGDAPKAYQYLDKSFVAGFDDFDHIYNDEDWDSLRNTSAFKAILVKFKAPQLKL